MNARILQIRKEQKLTQDAFAEKLKLSKNYVWQMEKGERTPSDRTISDICREFNVNEQWLRTGQGDMYIPPADKLENYLGMISKGDDVFIKDIVEVYMELDQTSKEALKQIGIKMADRVKKREQE